MDKSWMKLPGRHLPNYMKGIKDFIEYARPSADRGNRIKCPCRKCNNRYYEPINVAKAHLELHGMDKSYTRWVFHGEDYEVMTVNNESSRDGSSEQGCDGLREMLENVWARRIDVESNVQGETSSSHDHSNVEGEEPQPFDAFSADLHLPLYPGCKKFSKLEFFVKLMHIKTINGWSNKSFDMILELIKMVLPTGGTLPKSNYECKKYMRELGLGYVPIHACKYDCALYSEEHENETECPQCGEPRYKVNADKSKKIPQKLLRYFSLKARLQRLFMSTKTAGDMRWHKEKRIPDDNVLTHPADSLAWEEFDKEHCWFAQDPRNVRLGIASDGFNPFGDMSNSYSMASTHGDGTSFNSMAATSSSDQGSTSRWRGRGRAKKTKLSLNTQVMGGKPTIVIPPGLTQPVGHNLNMFKAKLGIICRCYAPIAAATWKEMEDFQNTTLRLRLEEAFNIDLTNLHMKFCIAKMSAKILKEFRYEMHVHYNKMVDAGVDVHSHPYHGVSLDDWDIVCIRFEGDDFKEISKKNATNRAKLQVNHRGGSKLFVQYLHETHDALTQKTVGQIELWRMTHFKEGKGWVTPQSQHFYDDMINLQSQPTIEGSEALGEEEICKQVLGTRSGYVKGLGHGKLAPPSSSSSQGVQINELRRLYEVEQRRNEALEGKIEHIRETMKTELQEQLQERVQAEVTVRMQSLEERHRQIEAAMEESQKRMDEFLAMFA